MAITLKVAVCPTDTLAFAGWAVMVGASIIGLLPDPEPVHPIAPSAKATALSRRVARRNMKAGRRMSFTRYVFIRP